MIQVPVIVQMLISISQMMGGIVKRTGEVLDRGTGLSSTIRVAAPVGQLAADAVPDKPAEIPAGKGDVRNCIAS